MPTGAFRNLFLPVFSQATNMSWDLVTPYSDGKLVGIKTVVNFPRTLPPEDLDYVKNFAGNVILFVENLVSN